MVTAAMKLKNTAPWKKNYDKPKQWTEKQRHHFAEKGLSSQSYGFSSSHVLMWELDHKEGWDAFELWCWRRLLRDPGIARRANQSIVKEINPEHSLRDWCWSWNANTLATWCEEPAHWTRPWCWKRLKGEMVRQHHCPNGYETEQTLGDSEGQGSLVCYSP